jgi:(p)ppGpp synthase/HD superfamily hydrolase
VLGAGFDRALALATDHHRRQLRKGSEVPYVSHLLGVTALVLEAGGTEDEAIAALLHDAVEDGGGPAMQVAIADGFGEPVARIVAANSDTDVEPKPPWRARKEAYIEAVAHKAPDELLVSIADKLHNARAITLDYRALGDEVWTRFKAGDSAGVLWYYHGLFDAFSARRSDLSAGAAALLDELGRTLDELDALVDR